MLNSWGIVLSKGVLESPDERRMEMADGQRTDEAWVPTTCYGCFPSCAIQVHRKDGKLVGSRGDPKVYSSYGK